MNIIEGYFRAVKILLPLCRGPEYQASSKSEVKTMRIPNFLFALVCLVFTTLVLGKPGASKSIWGGWTGMGDITSMNGKIYVTNSGTLYETMTDGKY